MATTLPAILVPPGIPPFTIEGHSIETEEKFASVQFRTGESRLRRLYTGSVPRTAMVRWELSGEQMAVVDDWAENTLVAYSKHFAAQIANHTGTGTLYYDANWVEPYTAEPLDGYRWVVTGKLYLLGPGSDVFIATALLKAELFAPVYATGALVQDIAFAAELYAYVTTVQPLKAEILVEVIDPYTIITPPAPPPPAIDVPAVPYGDFLRLVAAFGSGDDTVVLAASYNDDPAFADAPLSGLAFYTRDGVAYTARFVDDPAIAQPLFGVGKFNASIGSHYLSLYANTVEGSAFEAIGNTDFTVTPAVITATSLTNDYPGEFATGYPQVGGTSIAVGALYSDGSTYHVIGKPGNFAPDDNKMYHYTAGTNGVFSNAGQLTQAGGDPNLIADGHFGSFEAKWFTPTSSGDESSQLTKVGGRWFLLGPTALYYTDSGSGITGWRRADLRIPIAQSLNRKLVSIGSYLIVADGTVAGTNKIISVSTDNGSTWTSTAQPSIAADSGMLRLPSYIGTRAFAYYYKGAFQKVAYADAPYTSWATADVTGLPLGHFVGDNAINAFGGLVIETDHAELAFTLDGINFGNAQLVGFMARETEPSSPAATRNYFTLRQDGTSRIRRERDGL